MLRLPGLLSSHHYSGGSLLRSTHGALSRELKSVRTGEVVLSSFTFGLIQGRWKPEGGLTLLLPIDLLAGLTFHTLGIFGPKHLSHHFHAVADGALASFFTTTGYRVGERTRAGKGFIESFKTGMFGETKEPAGGATIADKELSNLVRAGV